jgi:uncharacterized membrane protein YecN with MAPEG domain
MTTLPITLLAAAAAAAINIWLGYRVVQVRVPLKISVGDGGNEAVLRRMRAHANFGEHAPIFLVLLAAIELAGGNGPFLAVVAAAFVLSRLAHGVGMDGGSLGQWRSVGMITNTLAVVVLAVWAAILAVTVLA